MYIPHICYHIGKLLLSALFILVFLRTPFLIWAIMPSMHESVPVYVPCTMYSYVEENERADEATKSALFVLLRHAPFLYHLVLTSGHLPV